MITVNGDWFALETANTGYYLGVRGGLVENLHYGARVRVENSVPLREKTDIGYGGDVVYRAESAPLSLEHLCLELSPLQKGDYRAQSLSLVMPGGARTADFSFVCARRLEGSVPPEGMPAARGGAETLALDFSTPEGVAVTLFYTVYPDCDVITRRLCIKNGADAPVTLEKALSYQLDLPGCDYVLSTFPGAWARERHEACVPLTPGAHVFGSTTGASSAFCNPFFMLCAPDATEFNGDAYGFNLVYSGSHMGCVEVSPWGKTRVAAGIQPEGFAWTLAPGERFETPEAVLTFSRAGKNGMSANLHAFVQEHIVRGKWAKKDRPVLLNNWEATYFDFNERKLLSLAKDAAKLGAELFVLDDGWFGERNDDNTSLGDWVVNEKKLGCTMGELIGKINDLGLKFGLWIEPEMVSEDSDLYREHPDWALQIPKRHPVRGRNQLVLDFSRKEIRDHVFDQICSVLDQGKVDYIKWDMNRSISDIYSSETKEQGKVLYDYVLGVYDFLERLLKRYPDTLIEGCSGGGGRFDAGMLYYTPQIWCSDNTDAIDRIEIQYGTSFIYPASCVGSHVSAVPNHQTGRVTSLNTRGVVAMAGTFGYELNLGLLSDKEKEEVKDQVKKFKAYAPLIQNGDYYRLSDPLKDELGAWAFVSEDRSEALVNVVMLKQHGNMTVNYVKMRGLVPEAYYRIDGHDRLYSGAALMQAGLPVPIESGEYLAYQKYLRRVEQ